MSDDLDELERRARRWAGLEECPLFYADEVLSLLSRIRAAERERDEAFKRGVKEGLRLFAWWKDGVEYVGTSGNTLKTALDMVDKGELP